MLCGQRPKMTQEEGLQEVRYQPIEMHAIGCSLQLREYMHHLGMQSL